MLLKQGMCVPRSVVTVRDHQVVLTIANLSPTKQTLYKQEKVAIASPNDADQVASDNESPTILSEKPLHEDIAGRIGEHLTKDQTEELRVLLKKYAHCFGTSKTLGRCTLGEHRIETENNQPVHQPPYRNSWEERREVQSQVEIMLDTGIVQESNSPWASPVLLRRKKSGEWRFCVDYRRLNAATRKDVYPLPRLDDALERFCGSKYFTTLEIGRAHV